MQEKDITEKEDKLALIVEDANTKLQQIINDSIMLGYNKSYAKSLVVDLIEETSKKLKEEQGTPDLINSTRISLQKRFMSDWLQVITILNKNLKKDKLGVIGKTIEQMQTNTPLEMKGDKGIAIDLVDDKTMGIAKASVYNIRDFVTDNALGGTSKFIDYTTLLNNTLIEVKDKIADGTLTLTDSLGRTKSVRNMAEIETRYKMIGEDLKRQGLGQGSFVVASSHSDASERCSFWQGKIYLVDLDIASRPMGEYKGGTPTQTVLGHIDGKPYYSLKQACENGFLSFNCQHRLIKYYKGIAPIQYPMGQVNKARKLTQKQRSMENTIRHWKRKEKLADNKLQVNRIDTPYIGDNGNWWINGKDTGVKASNKSQGLKSIGREPTETTTEKKYNTAMSNFWNDKYRQFSEGNGLPVFEWRTRITEYEGK